MSDGPDGQSTDEGAHRQADLTGDRAEGTGKYNTPLDWAGPVAEAVGGFDLDPCASADSNLADQNIRETGGLEADWAEIAGSDGWVWCNHPYSSGEPGRWLERAASAECNVVTLSKAGTSTAWFWHYLLEADLLCFPNTAAPADRSGRISFVGEESGADFPNVFGVFAGGEIPDDLASLFETWGWTPEP